MPLNIFQVKHELTSPIFAQAYAQGCGGIVKDKYEGGEWRGFGSPVYWNDVVNCQKQDIDFVYGDHAYFKRHEYYKITKNALFHDGAGHSDGKRFESLNIKIKKRRQGEKIIICPQSDGYLTRAGYHPILWLDSVIKELQLYTDRQIIVKRKYDRKPLNAYLKDAYAVIGYTSLSCLEAVINGVPAISLGESSASALCSNDLKQINNLYYPEKDVIYNHCSVLADNQFTIQEIKSGKAYSYVEV